MSGYAVLYFFNHSIQLFIMEGIYARLLTRKRDFWKRMALCFAGYFGAGSLLAEGNRYIGRYWAVSDVLYFLILFAASLGILAFLFEARRQEILFVGVAGYASQHAAYCFESLVWRKLLEQDWDPILIWILDEAVLQILFFLAVGLILYRILVKANRRNWEIKDADLKMTVVSFVVLFISTVLSVMVNEMGAEMETLVVFRIYGALSCCLGLALQFDISSRNRLETENEMLEQMLHTEKHQQEMAKTSIDMINMKCHDLKHQVQALENIDNRGMRRRAIEDINAQVMIYDSTVSLGNDALDLVITEKSLYCQKYHIKFSYMADGEKLSFMDSTDIFSLFGNAIDNAIECAAREPEEKRIISLEVGQRGEMLLIRLENYCSREIQFEDGLPVTTKKDRTVHGFGTKSIRYIAGRYAGIVDMYLEEGKFYLNILFDRYGSKE